MNKGIKKKGLLAFAASACMVCVLAFALAGCSGGQNSTQNGDAQSSNSADIKTLTVGFDPAYPPYGFVGDDGQYTGFDLDLAKEVCNRNGWEFKAEPIDWDAKDALLGQGAINCIWNGFTMEGREGQYTFSDPYMLNEQVIVVKSGSNISQLSDLSGKTVMTQVDSAALDVLETPAAEDGQADLAATFTGGAPQTIGNYNDAFLQLDAGTVDAVACDLSIAQYQIAANPSKYTQLSEALSTENYAVGFKLGNSELAQKVTATLKEMAADGTVKQLCEKYAQYGLSYDNWELK
ncbi:transporter substrate-binding domain-containing protein [Cryptobacterium curtum]|uniref:transporter substrate-binding domain-containing protein n=1 Tax=Cryptobacterium curtum TaxID=84163 RepID=UPI00248F14DC|nr:transporter substrate-binding domain-containing protein [Cryptobacterium curtum]